jgi:hypothetical protein
MLSFYPSICSILYIFYLSLCLPNFHLTCSFVSLKFVYVFNLVTLSTCLPLYLVLYQFSNDRFSFCFYLPRYTFSLLSRYLCLSIFLLIYLHFNSSCFRFSLFFATTKCDKIQISCR